MLRLNDIKLPLDHAEADLAPAVIERLGIAPSDLLTLDIYKRSYDARNKQQVFLIYQIDVTLSGEVEGALLANPKTTSLVRLTPNTDYQFVAAAPSTFPQAQQQRPLVIGFGPCGLLAALLLAQMGLKPIVLERGQNVR